ncbi:MAG: hypothetical protein J5822_04425 [Eubacteriaceae bacterium]|nr:hypothetical protein [Eubacteriaceae bacterium]
MDQALWEKCVSFHGHSCPGLATGVRAALIALDFFMDDITDEDSPGISCRSSTSKCPSDGIRCVLNIDDGRGLTTEEKPGELVFDFSKDGKHIILTSRPGGKGLSMEENIIRILMGKAEDIFDIKTRY